MDADADELPTERRLAPLLISARKAGMGGPASEQRVKSDGDDGDDDVRMLQRKASRLASSPHLRSQPRNKPGRAFHRDAQHRSEGDDDGDVIVLPSKPHSDPPPPPPQFPLTPLHYEVADFARRCAPSLSRIDEIESAIRVVDAASKKVHPAIRAVPFGSQATGLALPWSDLDIVILGLEGEWEGVHAGDFTQEQRGACLEVLEKLREELENRCVEGGAKLVAEARVPLLKLELRVDGGGGGGEGEVYCSTSGVSFGCYCGDYELCDICEGYPFATNWNLQQGLHQIFALLLPNEGSAAVTPTQAIQQVCSTCSLYNSHHLRLAANHVYQAGHGVFLVSNITLLRSCCHGGSFASL